LTPLKGNENRVLTEKKGLLINVFEQGPNGRWVSVLSCHMFFKNFFKIFLKDSTTGHHRITARLSCCWRLTRGSKQGPRPTMATWFFDYLNLVLGHIFFGLMKKIKVKIRHFFFFFFKLQFELRKLN
jgi:hypothetical protein